MAPHVQYNPENPASYAADKSSIRIQLVLAAASVIPLRHIDISSASTAEKYTYDKPAYEKQMTKFDGGLHFLDRLIVILNLNLYGSKPASHI